MTQRSELLDAISRADGSGLPAAVAALAAFDRQAQAQAAADRELDLSGHFVTAAMTPVPLHEHHTAATDWLLDVAGEQPADYRTAMITEAATWIHGLDPAVAADAEEFTEQARGRARTAASAFGEYAGEAQHEFLQAVAYLAQRTGASGLPQIDQLIDPNNQPAPTPYPTEVFDNFAPEVNDFNGGVESDNHASAISSEIAPGPNQIAQQNAGGSGFGSGPEKPDEHSTSMDTSNSYAEIPLGPPGQIPTAAPGQGGGPSAPTPVTGPGEPQNADKRPQIAASYTRPDPMGFRWAMAVLSADDHTAPWHTKCAAFHYPDEGCGASRAHMASVAIDHSMTLDEALRREGFERAGAWEGYGVWQSGGGSLQPVIEHHNRILRGFTAAARTEDEVAWLHGYLATVRPLLSEGITAESAKGLAGGGGVTEKERKGAEHHLPGTDKFPVSSGADVENAKHDIGRTSEPKGKVRKYINEMAEEYGEAPLGGEKKDKKKKKAAGLEMTARKCGNCRDGDCADCEGGSCSCTHPAQSQRFKQKKREGALQGSPNFP